MCGITGLVQSSPLESSDERDVKHMMEHLRHRGPDESGVFRTRRSNRSNGLMLGHRRLSIIDLETGREPLVDPVSGVALVYNGEVYNYQSLRERLRREMGYNFRTTTDAEVLLPLYRRYGLSFVEHLRGMFAFALWDPNRERLVLSRDRVGQKPLFYARNHERLIFASELSAFVRQSSFAQTISDRALYLYTVLGYIPAPFTIYEEVHKLPPATTLTWEDGTVSMNTYWSLSAPGTASPLNNTNETKDRFRSLFRDAVTMRLQADVPVGAFLSGGLDSSVIVSMMSQQTEETVSTFSIGFDDPAFDETPYARKQAGYTGTDHHETTVTASDLDLLPELARHYGEPFGDSSALPTYCLSAFASDSVKVALSGDGGDECFGGYNRYRAMKCLEAFRFVSASSMAGEFVRSLTDLLPTPEQRLGTPRIAARLFSLLPHSAPDQYLNMTAIVPPVQARDLIRNDHLSPTDDLARNLFEELMTASGPNPGAADAAYADLHLYLPGDLLTKVDVASMAHALEVRSPFLDPEILDFSARLPFTEKATWFQSKIFLKQTLNQHVHPDLRNRPKKGFGIPVGDWLRRNEGKKWLKEITRPSSAVSGFYRADRVEQMVNQHRSGTKNHRDRLWLLIMFELWYQEFM